MSRKLLVTVDSLRQDHFEYMPATRSFLDREHDRAYSTFPETFGSFPSIIGGQYATERGLQEGTSLANELDGHGVGVTTNHLLSPGYNYDEGFDHFCSPAAGGEGLTGKVSDRLELGSTAYAVAANVYNTVERVVTAVSPPGKSFRRASDVISEFLEETSDADSWFGWLHFMEPHHPYDPHSSPVSRDRANRLSRRAVAGQLAPENAELVRELYRREVEELDVELRRLYEAVPADTEVLFAADHGELLGEDDTWGHPGLLHPLLHHVPFGTRNVDHDSGPVVSMVDVPTLLTGDEHGRGEFQREVAFGLYGDRRAAMNREHVTTYDPEDDTYRTRTVGGGEADRDEELVEAIRSFDLAEGVTRYDADEEQLRELGYLG
jgi:hypothetical protein